MQQIVKRLTRYTQEDYKAYCKQLGIDYHPDNLKLWAMDEQENDMWDFILSKGKFRKTTVDGYVDIEDGSHPVKQKITTLESAFDKMLTPDIYDFEVFYDQDSDKYYVNCYHAPDYINLFQFVI